MDNNLDETKVKVEETIEKPSTENQVVDEKTTTEEIVPSTNTETIETVVEEIAEAIAEEEDNDDGLKSIDKDFIYDIMSVPTNSRVEYRMVTYVILWARRNNIKYEFDNYGNIYLTKGTLNENEFYPCVTSHLDTVQDKAKPYAEAGVRLEIKTRVVKEKHELYVDDMGIGADDKAGVAICLSMFSHFDKLKACFFLEEEVGCVGSKNLNKDWFKDVGYVIGYDSPDRNRAAYSCSGTKLFNQAFFKEYMQDICKEHGVDDFRAEPFTDVKEIREQTDIICMNFGNGGYNAHMPSEYCILEDMDAACTMGIALIEHIGLTEHKLKHASYIKDDTETELDYAFYAKVAGRQVSSSSYNYGGYNYGSYGGSYNRGSSYTPTTHTVAKKTIEDDKYEFEQIRYVIEVYETHLEQVEDKIKEACKENNISFDIFKSIFDKAIKF